MLIQTNDRKKEILLSSEQNKLQSGTFGQASAFDFGHKDESTPDKMTLLKSAANAVFLADPIVGFEEEQDSVDPQVVPPNSITSEELSSP